MARATKKRWIQSATERMRRRGTLGSYGKATSSKLKRDLHSRNKKTRKKAVFARNMKRIAAKRRRSR